jgi:uncharacterized membrane protein
MPMDLKYGRSPFEKPAMEDDALQAGRRVGRGGTNGESTTVDTERSSLARALSWRVVAWSLTVGIAYLFTGQAVLALAIGVADSLLKIFAYYLHERSWLSLGRAREPDQGAVAFAAVPSDARS